jgi:hypothetical protein
MAGECSQTAISSPCWLACFDLLGFKRKTYAYARHRYGDGSDGLSMLAGQYLERALFAVEEEVKRQGPRVGGPLYSVHFSDTFILYAAGGSDDSFLILDSATRTFFTEMVLKRIPLRGALTYGHLYADRAKGIFLGPALIEAYEYAERQNWIGFILTPQASARLSAMDPPLLPSVDHAEWDVPMKVRTTTAEGGAQTTAGGTYHFFAFRMSNYPSIPESIGQMEQEARNESEDDYRGCLPKYQNTLRFMERTKLTP